MKLEVFKKTLILQKVHKDIVQVKSIWIKWFNTSFWRDTIALYDEQI